MTWTGGRRASYRRRLAAVVVAVGLLVLLAACGGSARRAGSTDGGSSGPASAVAYSACVRAHGVPDFPDPGSGGQLPKADAEQLGVSSSRLLSAQRACAQLVPTAPGSTEQQQEELRCATDGDCPPSVVQQWMSGLRALATCLRTHGVPRWPDPIITALAGRPPAPHFPYEQAGVDHHSPQVLTKVQACVQQTGFQGLPLP